MLKFNRISLKIEKTYFFLLFLELESYSPLLTFCSNALIYAYEL